MITKADARQIAQKFIDEMKSTTDILLQDDVMELVEGWVFFYNSKEFLETHNFMFALTGNAPIIVTKEDGELYITGTAFDLDYYINEFRRALHE